DTPIELWDVGRLPALPRTSEPIGAPIEGILSDHRDRIAVRSPNGKEAITRLMTTGFEPVAALDGWPIGFRPDHEELVVDLRGRLAIYASRDGRLLREIAEAEPLWQVGFSPSGAVIATRAPHRVALRDADWRVVSSFETPGDVTALAVDDSGRIVTGHEDGTVRIWNGSTGELLATATGHAAYITEIAL